MQAVLSRCVPDIGSVATVLLAGGRGTRLHELTEAEAKPAIHFAGSHRIVDFAMANIVRSGLQRLLVATQFAPHTLAAHIPLHWGSHFSPGSLLVRDGRDAYRGTADAVRRNWPVLVESGAEEILVLAADHVYAMDYAQLIQAHRAARAEVTVAVDVVPQAEAREFGVMQADRSGRIVSFREKPADPPAIIGEPGFSMASMGVYVFSRCWLDAALADDDALDFGHHLIPRAVADGVAMAYRLPASPETGRAYWRDVGTLDALRLTQLDFAEALPVPLPDAADAHSWRFGRDSVLMPGASVSRFVRLARAIVSPGAHLPPGLVVGEDPVEDRRWFRRTEGGTVLVTPAMLQRRAQLRPRKTLVALRSVSPTALGARLRPALDNPNA
ncbi:ADP-glucose pyrophosphorylase [Pelagibacterium lacus]|uniref:ADP-glucose pyrophosphorylase n=1 Tax=Pelagibacterium lacus TaxID=2282655 RepID=A0A369W5W0_9HYPH|nr:ADP-glucose pyrophosphorylase [Pelagibacterium lacus]